MVMLKTAYLRSFALLQLGLLRQPTLEAILRSGARRFRDNSGAENYLKWCTSFQFLRDRDNERGKNEIRTTCAFS